MADSDKSEARPDNGETGARKSENAFRTIGELSNELGLPQHILRYWEVRFPQLRPLTRAGNRRYYRPEDVALVKRIHTALNRDGYTIKGAQKLLKEGAATISPTPPAAASTSRINNAEMLSELKTIRQVLAAAISE